MTEEQVSKIFDEYSRFNDAINRSVEGTGLGMSITQNLICLMGGSIAIESKPGKGSTFIVRLPQKKADTEVLGREMAENLRRFRMDNRALLRRAQISREPMPYGNILIVDDVETNVYVAKGLLIPYGLKIDSADSGYTAIDIIKSGKIYDIIFMDHMMPEMDGIEAVKQIRALGYEHPIVALTANAVAGQADVFMNNGFDGFISKPIDLRQMNMLLNKLIRDKQPPEVIEAARQGAVAEMEQALKAKPQQQAVQSKKTVLNAEVAGLDIPKGLEQVNGDEAAYIKILRSYTDNIRSMLRSIETVSENSLSSYKITVHGIKGTSYYIFARQVGSLAEALEKASAAGDFSYVSEHNPAFLETAQKLLSDLEGVISAFDAENPRPKKDRPDDKLLLKLLDACQRFDMDDLDSAMEEIERYQYESDGGLAVWLRETANMMDMARIVEKLTDMGVGS
jgi:CheY-like chemotaxis protein